MTEPDEIFLTEVDYEDADFPLVYASASADSGGTSYIRTSLLSDPVAVHLNMLRGTIAKPSLAQIAHIYGDEWTAALAAEVTRLAEALATVTAERDEARAHLSAANNEFGSATWSWPDLWRRIAQLKELSNERWQRAEAAEAALDAAHAEGVAEGLRMAAGYHQGEIDRLNEVISSNDEYAARTGRHTSQANAICYNKRAMHDLHMRAILALIPAPPKPADGYSEGVAAGMKYGEAIAIAAIEAMPGAGPFRLSGKDDDWRFRAALARKEALDAAGAYIRLAFKKDAPAAPREGGEG